MPVIPFRLPHWPAALRWLVLAASLSLATLGACLDRATVFPGAEAVNFVDADCYARMTRVQEVCLHPGEVIRRHAFENYPYGIRPHTTLPLDYAVWILRGMVGLGSTADARDLAGAWVSPLLGAVTMLGVWLGLERSRPHAAWLALLVLAASPILAHGFQLGRPDHQSLALASVAWALAAEWAQWRAPSRRWGLVGSLAWALGLWTTLYEPLVLLTVVLAAGLIWNRPALLRRERLPGLAAGGGVLLLALLLEGWRIDALPGYGESGEVFAAWTRQIGELAGIPPWSPVLYAWTGVGLLAAPVLLWRVPGQGRPAARAQLLMLATVFVLTCWQVRWGYFLPLVYALSLPAQAEALPPRWRPWAGALLLLGLWPTAAEWRSRLDPTAAQTAALIEQQADTAQLHEVAAFIRRSVAETPVPPDSHQTDDGAPDAGILAPWWQSPPLVYWSGQPAVAGSSHESLPGTVDTARFYLSADPREGAAILRRRRVRWIVAYEPDRVLQTAGQLLGRDRVSNHCMAELLYRRPDLAPRFLRLALANPYFKVYEVRSALLPPTGMKDSTTQPLDIPSYDFVVIGGGSAGFAAARTAADLGLKTALVEGGREVGGLCILRGCMPSKTMIESANRFVTLRRAREFGLRAEDIRVVGPEIQARKRRLVGEFADYRREQLETGKFDYIRGLVRFLDEHRLAIAPVDGGQDRPAPPPEIHARTMLIATGSKVAEVPIPGLKEVGYLTSDDVLELEEFPKSVVMLGAGAIGLEASHQLAGLGTEVTVIQRCGHVMREADADVAGALEQALTGQGVRFHTDANLLRAELDADGKKRVWFECGGRQHSAAADEIIFALGRQPCTDRLDVNLAGVELTKKGGVRIGPDQRSSRRHIFAAGDVCGPYEIVHLAIQQAEIAARNAARHLGVLDDRAEETDYRLKLFVLFTEPQMAMVGLSEREAGEAGRDCVAATYPFADHGKSIVMGETDGFVKLIADRATGELLGGAVVGPEAAELIHEVTVAMAFRATAAQLAVVPHYHPTLSEIWTYPAEELAHRVLISGTLP